MTKFRVGIILVLICSLLLGVASAEETAVQALPGNGWISGIQIQNIGTTSATIELVGYDRATGAAQTASSQTASSGASVNFLGYPASQTSFDGSGVVSADQPIVGIVNVTNKPVNAAAGQYQATDGASTASTIRFPLVKSNFGGRCTYHYLQNAGTADATITATYSGGQTQAYPGVKPGQSVLIEPATAGVPSTTPFALTVTSNGQPMAGTMLETPCTNPVNMQATRGLVPSDFDTTMLVPIMKQKYPTAGPRSNGVQVQNTSTSVADITIVFKCAVGACGTNSYTQVAQDVPAGASATFFNNGVVINGITTPFTGASVIPDNSLLAGTVTGVVDGTTTPVQLAAIVSETGVNSAGFTYVTSYSAPAASKAAAKLGIPQAKEEFGNNGTGIVIQNASSSAAATVNVEYKMTAGAAACQGTYNLSNINIPAGSSVTLFRLSLGGTPPGGGTWGGTGAVKAGCFGGVTVTATSGTTVAMVQETTLNVSLNNQDNKNYEAFPIQ